MLKIWGRTNSINVQKVLWCCEELGLEYERIDAGLQFGVVNDPGFRRLNPNGLVPTIEDDGFVLWESNAIVRYLCAKHGRGTLLPDELTAQASSDRWMDWQATTLWPPLRTVFWGLVRTPPAERDEKAIEAARIATADVLQRLDNWLSVSASDYVAGDTLTMCDIALGAAIYRWMAVDVEHPAMPALEAWYQRLGTRAAYRNVVMTGLS